MHFMMKTKNFAIGMMVCWACALALGMIACSSGETITVIEPETVVSYKVQNATPNAVVFVPGNYTISRTDEEHLKIVVMDDGLEVKDYSVTHTYSDDGKQLKHSNIQQSAVSYFVDEDDPENKSLWVVSARNTERATEFYDFIYNDKQKGDVTIDMNYKSFTLSDSLQWPAGNYDLRFSPDGEGVPVYSILINNQTKYIINYTKDNDGKLKEVAIRIPSKNGNNYEYKRSVILNNFKY